MAYKRKPTARAKKNFRKVARKMVYNKRKFSTKPAKGMGDTRDFLKITMHREITKSMMDISSDRSMHYTILFNPKNNIAPNTDHAGNLLYHPDFSCFQNLYKQYKVSCIVLKLTRANQNFMYGNTTPNQVQSIQLPSVEWGTKVLHSTLSYQPDAVTNNVQGNAVLTPRVNLQAPTGWREAVDDGRQLFKNHHYKRSCTRVWKPVGPFEKRWRRIDNDDNELARGGIHIRLEHDRLVDYGVDDTRNNVNWNYRENAVVFDIDATIYMHYRDRA